VLLAGSLAIIFYLPPIALTVFVGVAGLLAYLEYATLAAARHDGFPRLLAGVGTLVTFVAVWAAVPLPLVLAPALLVAACAAVGRGRPEEDVLRLVAVTLFPLLYLGLPLGMTAAVHADRGPLPFIVPFLTIVASDSAQYFGGRAFGRHPLAPRISPKKTMEGAACGLVVAAGLTPVWGGPALPQAGLAGLLLLGLLLGLIGIIGDLFESLLKRSAGVKDSSQLIPGHGGMLDRIDALLFAFPAYVLFVRYAGW
jgi:phosphatidate cytidylyltransferase